MIIDYLESGSDDCPLIRLKHGSHEDYNILIGAIKILIDNGKKVNLFSLEGINKGDNMNELILMIDEADSGTSEFSLHSFVCQFSKEHLLQIIEKIENYKTAKENEYNWLNDDLNISILLSYTGKW